MNKIDELTNFVDLKFLRIVRYLDNHITKNLRDASIATRPASTNGLWCCTLLPAVLVIYAVQYKLSELYIVMACLSMGMFLYSLLFTVFVSVSCLVLNENIFGGCMACSFSSGLCIYLFTNQGIFISLGVSIVDVYLFSSLLKHTILKYPKTFTIGEAILVTESIVLFLTVIVLRLCFRFGDYSDREMEFVYTVNLTILSTVGIIVTAIGMLNDDERNMQNLWYILSVASIYALVVLHLSIGFDSLLRVFCYVFLDRHKVKLFFLWASLAGMAVVALVVRTKLAVKASTVTRKTFHILASLVFFTGYVCDIHLMTLAAGCGLGLVILLETLRKSGIEPLSSRLNAAFQVYSDDKDAGCFAMTPMYLYVGLACPLILVPYYSGYELEMLSGVLSIGVGDTAASWFGSNYGTIKWTGTEKTQEGTAFNIISQLAVVYALRLFKLLDVNYGMLRALVAAIVSGMVEAKTEQVDNLTLPLVTIISFQLTSFCL